VRRATAALALAFAPALGLALATPRVLAAVPDVRAPAPDGAGSEAAEMHVVLLWADGTLTRATAAEVDADALPEARAAWVWTDDAAPRRLAGASLDESWRELRQKGLETGPGSLSVDLPAGDERASGTLIAAPAAMWREVPESWLPRFTVPKEGPIELPREPSTRWRMRYTASAAGTWWSDVPAGRPAVRLYPVAANDLVTGVTTAGGEGLGGASGATDPTDATLTVLEEVASTADPQVIALQRADSEGTFRLPALPADRPATFLVGAPGYSARPFRGRARDLPALVRLTPGAELRGRFEDAHGQPVAGVRVAVEGWLTDDVPVRFERRARSGDDGSWKLPAVSLRPLVLTARHADFAPFVAQRDPSAAGVVDLGRVVLERGAALAVAVVGRDGEPIAGAEVSADRLPLPAVASGEDGRARLAGLPSARPLALSVTASGYLPGQVSVTVPWPEEARVVLTRGFTVTGRFVDATGLPVAAGKVKVVNENHFRFADLAPDGGFELLLDPGLAWSIELSSATTRKRREEIRPGQPGERRDLGDLAAPPGLTVFGTLVSAADGTPVAGGRIWMPRPAASGVLVSWLYGDVAEATSDAMGRFEVGGLPPEPGLLRVDAPGFARTELAVQPEEEAAELDLGVVELGRGTTVVVRVEGLADDTPAPRARLDLRGEWQDLDMIGAPVVEGEAELPHVPAGSSHLTVVAGRDVLCEQEVTVEPDDDRAEVSCDARRAVVAGRVVVGDRAAGAGLLVWNRGAAGDGRGESVIQTRLTRSGLRQQSVAGGGRPEVLVEVDDDGQFRTDRLASGRWQVSWQPVSGTASAPRPVDVPAGEVADLLLQVPGLGLVGVVVGEDGEPVAQARVRELGSGAFSLTRADGSFRLDGLSAGEVQLQAQDADRFSEAVPVRLEADRPAEPVRLVVSADHQGQIPVRVWDGGAPAAGAFVFLQTEGSADLRLASAGGEGAAEIVVPAPRPSRVRVAVRHEGRWAFGEWTEWRRARQGIEVEIQRPGEILVAGDGGRERLSVLTGDGWDVGRLLTRLGAPPVLAPGSPLRLSGLPEGRYVLSLQGQASPGLTSADARTIVVTSGHREEVEMVRRR